MALLLNVLGIFINGVGTVSYVVDTLKGKIRPNRVTFFVWSLAPFVAFLSQVSQGVGVTSLMTLSVSIFPLSIFLASFVNKKAYWKMQSRDVICGILSIVGLLLWYVTKQPNIALIFSLISEGLATLPTILKAYAHPETESAWPWMASVASGVLTLSTLQVWSFANAAFPFFYAIEMLSIFILVQFRIGKK